MDAKNLKYWAAFGRNWDFLGFIEPRYTKLPGVKRRLADASRDLLELLFYSQALSRRS